MIGVSVATLRNWEQGAGRRTDLRLPFSALRPRSPKRSRERSEERHDNGLKRRAQALFHDITC
jgi:hypothetical protein